MGGDEGVGREKEGVGAYFHQSVVWLLTRSPQMRFISLHSSKSSSSCDSYTQTQLNQRALGRSEKDELGYLHVPYWLYDEAGSALYNKHFDNADSRRRDRTLRIYQRDPCCGD